VTSAEEPLLRVVKGAPADDELAALVAVVSAFAAAAAAARAEELRAPWSNPRALVRPPMSHGRGAWRASGLPG
jgi:acyl-CoA carboxylase epsilon subunit